jgi:hypothetical protein
VDRTGSGSCPSPATPPSTRACGARTRHREPLVELGPALWEVVDELPLVGRVLFGAHLAVPRPEDPLLSGWHAVNCLREWRGDTHWAITVAEGLGHAEASILHNAWLDYEADWLATSGARRRPTSPPAGASLEARGLARDRTVLPEGIALRQRSRTPPTA